MRKCWCGNEDLRPYSEYYMRCTACKTLVSAEDLDSSVVRVQNEDSDLYGSNYWKEQMVQMTGERSLDGVIDRYLTERTLYWIKNMLKYKLPGVKSAELGCGLGQFSYLMDRTGFIQTATELSPEICQFIRETLGLLVVQGSAGQLEQQYDIIASYDVIEHVTEPISFLQEMAAHLQEDGIICIQTPCYDDALSFERMRAEKPRFEEQMKDREHVYLYSRSSIKNLLARLGFTYCEFEPAFFGDDYDMYLFASRKPIRKHTQEEIDAALNQQRNGRLVKALLRLFEEKQAAEVRSIVHENDSNERLKQVQQMEAWLQDSEKDRQERLIRINALESQLAEANADREARLLSIQSLETRLEESDADRQARLTVIQSLEAKLAESEADRAARLSVIQTLEARLAESEEDRAARLVSIQELTEQIQQFSKQ